jgi:signal transduction histidine kinase
VTDIPASQFSAADPIDGGELRLPRPPGVIRRFWARHQTWADTILALVIGALATSGAINLGRITAGATWLNVAAVAAVGISVTGVYIRRTRPLATFALSAAAAFIMIWAPSSVVLAPMAVAIYAVAVHRSARAGWIAAAAAWTTAVAMAGAGDAFSWREAALRALALPDQAGGAPLNAVPVALFFALALAVGINVGNRRRYLAALIDRARQLAHERDEQGRWATAIERARIAREMHDIVSHSLTVMVALAEGSAAAATAAAPDAAAAMRTVADTGRGAMVDMRRMLGVLGGDPDADTAPQPGISDLPELLGRFRSLQVPVSFRSDGAAPHDPAVQLTVYRLVQESLTNALRYSIEPTEVLVTLTRGDGRLTVTVADDGLGGGGPRPKPAGSGRGLIGLRERVTAIGGTLTAGPRTDGRGWIVQATLVLDAGMEVDGA